MYSEFFGLTRRPFSAVPSAEDFTGASPIQDALDAVIHCVSQASGIAVVSSPSGMGKTMLCKRMTNLLRPEFRCVYLSGAGIETRRALLQAILFELGADYVGLTEQEARLQLFQSVRELSGDLRALLLIIDEAHLLRPRMFEELRTLADYAPDGPPLIRLVLCGPFELEEKLTDPALTSFNQRIGVQVGLASLTLEESAQFLKDRFRNCGNPILTSILTPDAIEIICRASDGNLRCLTQLTDHSLLLAFTMDQCPVSEEIVRTALDDLKELPLRWSEVPLRRVTTEHSGSELQLTETSEAEPAVSRRIYSSAELETDEFPIPDFLIGNPGLISSEAAPALVSEISRESDNMEMEEAQSSTRRMTEAHSSPVAEPHYAVFEVGSEMVENEVASPPVAWGNDFPFEFTPGCVPLAPMFYSPMMASPASAETEMEEIPVVDRYTLLDRFLELPEERRSAVDLSQLAEIPQEEVFFHAETESTSFSTWESESQDPSSEAQILNAIHQIRRDVLGQLDKTSSIQPIPQPQRHDIVQPESNPKVSIPFAGGSWEPDVMPASERPAAAESAPPAEGRFSQLFSRLRSRRQRLEKEMSGR